MRKYVILAVLMAFVVAAVSGCGLVVKDAEVDAQTVIIEVAGQSIVKADVQKAIENVLNYNEYLYSYYGATYDRTDVENIAKAQETAIDSLIQEAVTDQKIAELGLDQFTADELTAIEQTVEDSYASNMETVKSYSFADTELTGDELTAAIEAKMIELGYGTKEALLDDEKHSISLDKLRDYVVKDVAVTDEEIQSKYETSVAEAITNYGSYPTQYASDVSNGAIIYYKPAGYRYVKNLLIKISDEDSAAIDATSTLITEKNDTLTTVEAAIANLPEDAEKDTEEEITTRTELTAQQATLTEEIETLTAQLNEQTEAAFAAIQPKVDEVEALLASGENFDDLLATYGEDPGMTTEPAKTTGYLVCAGLTTYLEDFVTESMALAQVGDVSAPFRTSYGVHIVKYESNLQSGEVPLIHVHDEISAELLQSKQDTLYTETIAKWVSDADAKTYESRLRD